MGTRSGSRKVSAVLRSPLVVEQVRSLVSDEEALQHAQAFADQLDPVELAALQRYTGPEYDAINRTIAGLEAKPDPLNLETINQIDRVMDRTSAPFAFMAYRGIAYKSLVQQFDTGQLTPGTVITERGYASTSRKPEIADMFGRPLLNNGVVLNIRVPKGAKGAFLDRVSSHDTPEAEFLLPKNASYRVVSTNEGKSRLLRRKVRTIEVELIV